MEWFSGSIGEAVAEVKRSKKLFLVYIEGNDDMSKDMTNTYGDATIVQKLSKENILALKLAANSTPYFQFCAIYPVLIIPSSYFIGANGAPIEVITGNLVPTDFVAKIDRIVEIFERDSASKKDPQTASSSSDPQSSATEVKCVNSNEPSTSHSADDEKDVPPLEERVDRAKTLLEAKRLMKEQEEQEKGRKQELERRNVGKALQKTQQQNQDNELKEWARNRAKEKEEERLARQKVKDMIAQDRAERAARYQFTKETEQADKERLARIREQQEQSARNAALNSNQAHIQFRLPDGSSTSHIFSADSILDDARRFVIKEVRPPFSHFSLCTTFPRRQFTQSNYSESLRDLQLAPSAVLLILPDQTVSSISSSGNFFSNIFWMLLSPFTTIWGLITSLFPGSPRNRDQQRPPDPEPSPRNQSERNASQSGARRRDASFVKREGNIFRINNQSDDDENNTWNGNSTQQM